MIIFKRLEEWDIKLIKTIKSSLWLKIFLMITGVLIVVGIIIYGIVIRVMPSNYRSLTLSNYTEEIQNLVSELETGTLEEATNKIYDFCIDYSGTATLEGNDILYSFGQESMDNNTTVQLITSEVTFTDSNISYILTLSVSENTVNQIMIVFLKITPANNLVIKLSANKKIAIVIIPVMKNSKKGTLIDSVTDVDVNILRLLDILLIALTIPLAKLLIKK